MKAFFGASQFAAAHKMAALDRRAWCIAGQADYYGGRVRAPAKFVPDTDFTKAAMGGATKARLLAGGRPVAGAQTTVTAAGQPRGSGGWRYITLTGNLTQGA